MIRSVLVVVAAMWAGVCCASDKLVFAPPAAWVKTAASPTGAADPDDARPVRSLLVDFQVKYDEHGVLVYQRTVGRIQAPAGLAGGSVVLSWNPDTEAITVHQVHIIRGDQVIDVLGKGQTFTILRREKDLERAMLSGVLTATLQPEGLQVGDIVDLAYTRARRDPVMGGHDEMFLSEFPGLVIDQLRMREIWPSARSIRWREVEGLAPAVVTKTADETELVMQQTGAERPKPPEGAPARYDYLSVLEASDFRGWPEVSALMAPLYLKAATLAPSSPLKAEAAKIRASSSDPKVQAAAALRLVQDKIRYLFLGMNQGGYVPADADVTWTRRFGDCKGKTAVLLALLHELGIKAEPALVSSVVGDGMNERLPNIELFDHVLVRAQIGDAVYWMDGTRLGDRSLDDLGVPPFFWALPVTAQGAELEPLKPSPPPAPLLETKIRLDASAGLDAIAPAHVEIVFRGDLGTAMRMGLASKTPADVDKGLRDYWRGLYSWIEVKSAQATYDDATGTERITMEGAANMGWATNDAFDAREYESDGGRLGEGRDFKRDSAVHKDAPFAVPYPAFWKTEETIALPQGGKGFTVDGDDVDKTVAGVEYKRRSHIDGAVFTMVATTRAVATEIPAAEATTAKGALREMSDVIVHVRAPKTYRASDAELQMRLARTPSVATEFVDRADARVLKGDYEAAIQDYDHAVELKPDDPELLNARCFTRGIVNKGLDQAMADCDAALDQAPHNAAYLDSRGFVHFRMGDLDKAVTDLDAALKVDPKQAPTLFVRGLIERRKGDRAHGDADIKAAKALDPTVVATYAKYGVAP